MTKDQYKKEIKRINSEINDLHSLKNLVRSQFLAENAEFGVGDKVAIIKKVYRLGKGEEIIKTDCFISSIEDKYFGGDIKYEFSKIKKDGTMSGKSAGIYGYDKIELIEKAKS